MAQFHERHLVRLLMFALLAASSPLVHAAPGGLVPNGSFELEDSGTLAGWMPFDTVPDAVPNNIHGVTSGHFEAVWDSSSDGGGAGSLLIRGRGIRLPVPRDVSPLVARSETLLYVITPKIPVRENSEYKLTYSLRTAGMVDPKQQLHARIAFEVRFFAGNGKPGYGAHNGRIPNRTGKDNDTQLSVVDTPTHSTELANWQPFEAVIKTPAKATDLEIRVQAICTRPQHKFSAWIDNVQLAPVGQAAMDFMAPAAWKPRTRPATERGLATGDLELLAPPVPFGSRIQRTMKLLATSTPERRNKVRILCYGQSIMAGAWWRVLQAELQQRYPHADIEVVNRSLGGFMTNDLKNSAELDMIPFYPDLVILHDYLRNGPEELEEIYGNLHHRTTAEMLTLTHHLAWAASEGIFKGNGRAHDRESDIINEVANRHGFEVVQIRDNWRHLLTRLHPGMDLRLAAQMYLQDQVHLSRRGERLMEQITAAHFQYRPEQKPTWLDTIRVYQPDGSRWPQTGDEYPGGGTVLRRPLKFEFVGNRIDVMAMPTQGKSGTAKVLIDGKPPSAIPEIYTATRPSLVEASPWPHIMRVQLGGQPVEEDWTLTYTKVTPRTKPDGKPDNFEIEFDLTGSVTGPDGHGSTREKFVSKSGRVTLEPSWFLPIGFWPSIISKQPKVGTAVKWRVQPQGVDIWKPRADLNPTLEDRHVLAQGLTNAKHTLEILPNNDGPVGIRAIVVHQPAPRQGTAP